MGLIARRRSREIDGALAVYAVRWLAVTFLMGLFFLAMPKVAHGQSIVLQPTLANNGCGENDSNTMNWGTPNPTVTAGDTIVLLVSMAGNSSVTGVTSGDGSTWKVISGAHAFDSNAGSIDIVYAQNVPAETNGLGGTITTTTGNIFVGACVFEITGVPATGQLIDCAASTDITSNQYFLVSPSCTTTKPNELIVALAGSTSNGNDTTPEGGIKFAPIDGPGYGNGVAGTPAGFYNAIATGTYTAGLIQNPAASGAVAIVSFMGANQSAQPVPSISSFAPTSAAVGATVAVSGSNFTSGGGTPQVNLTQLGGGTVTASISSFSSSSISFVVPSGAVTGNITVAVNRQTAVSGEQLTIPVVSPPALQIVLPPTLSNNGCGENDSSSTMNIGTPNATVTAGDTLVILVGMAGDSHVTGFVNGDGSGNVWTVIPGTHGYDSSIGGSIDILYAQNVAAETNGADGTVITSSGNTFTNGCMFEITGAPAGGQLIDCASSQDITDPNTTTFVTPPCAITEPNELLVAMSVVNGVGNTTAPEGGVTFTPIDGPDDDGNGLADSPGGYYNATTLGTYQAGLVASPASPGAVSIVSFVGANQTSSGGAPSIASFTPTAAAVGAVVSVTGTNFTLNGDTPQITLSAQAGGTIPASVTSYGATSLSFVIPTGAATGPITVSVAGQSATSTTSLTIQSESSFGLSVSPGAATLLPGESVDFQVSLSSSDGFTQLAGLSVSGMPSGVSASFQPPQITAGGTSTLTLTAGASQPVGSATLSVTATATVEGVPETQTATATLNVQAIGNVAFEGRVAVTNPSIDVPLVGLTVRFTGVNYAGASTGCTASTTTDSDGNFVFSGLADACGGSQVVEYDPSTVTSPPGTYSGVNLSYVLTPGQVTTPGIVVHLPRVDNAETVMVTQASSQDQVFNFQSIPNLTMVVYAGTTFTLADGSQPNPFPLRVIEIPYKDLPEQMQPDPTQDPVYAMSIEPFNSSSSQPVAVLYPNRSNAAPGTNMPLTSLNPQLGMMVNYGTGTVSGNGAQIVPNLDPGHPGHLYGISHFDWFFGLPGPPNRVKTCPSGNGCAKGGEPVDLSSGVFTLSKTDIAFGGARGQIAITRTYRTLAPNFGPFGRGSSYNYNYLLDITNIGSGLINLTTPDQNQFPFVQQSDGTFVNSTNPALIGAVLSTPTPGADVFNLRWKNGTVYQFGTQYLNAIVDTNGNQTTFVRDANGTLMQITDPVGRSLNFGYALKPGLITSITDPLGRTIQYTYDLSEPTECGTLTSVTDAAGGLTKYAYDSSCTLTSITDPRGITYLQNTYDANGRVIKQVTADTGTTLFSYTQLNAAVSTAITGTGGTISNVNTSPVSSTLVTDPRGNVTLYFFDPQGFPTGVIDPFGQLTIYTRAAGTEQLLSVTDPLFRTTAYTYDANGNTTSVTRLSGTSSAETTAFTYDPAFNKVTTITDPLSHTTTFAYDAAGNLLSTTDPLTQKTAFAYDASGELTSSTDPLNNVTQFGYTNGDLTSITDPVNRTTTRVTDAVSRLTSLTNPLGQTAKYQYTPLNELAQVTDAQNNATSFIYDGNGNLLNLKDAKQNTTSYTYDSMDRLATRTDPLTHPESYQYDLAGNLTQFTDRRGVVTTYAYDALNRRSSAQFGSESSISYSYDVAGRLIQAGDSISGTIDRAYDGLDRLVGEATPEGSVEYTYDAAGRRTAMLVNQQHQVSYTYDDDNRVTQIAQGSSTVTFGYDNDGRRTSLTLPNGVTMSYSYDGASQLTGISYALGGTALGNLTYAYDLAGRRTTVGGSFARSNVPAALASASYNANNQMTQFGAAALAYDQNGNLTSDGTNTYTWNARNQLASISGGVAASFQYDAFGRRASKTVGGTTEYLYDGLNPVQELSGGTEAANLLTGLGVDEYFQRTDASGPANFLTDALGSTLSLTDSGGNTLASYTYEPFGNTSITGSSASPFQYTGRENDGTAGLYYLRTRYYSSIYGRFISEDPIGLLGGANAYAYVGENPVTGRDPLGLFFSSEHYDITLQAALAIGMDPQDAINLANAVAAVDSRVGTQEPDAYDANTHAMAGRKGNGKFQTCQQAEAGTEAQISDALNNGDVAKGLHTIQDSYSPAHAGFQQWDGGYDLIWISGVFGSASMENTPGLSHLWGDFQLSDNNAAVQNAIAATEAALQYPGLNPKTFLPRNACP